MPIKKSELYSSLWAGCDELRGSMDASQYKDYVLVMLFMKYVSDKGGELVDIPEGGSFKDMSKLKGQPDIGDKINKIIGELAKANDLVGIIDVADFNDDDKVGKGKEKTERLSNLISIFEKPELDFSDNRAEGDDILGDAYEYLMRHFATESGKSKGQFYTPAEVSRIMAKVIGIGKSQSQSETIYDPTCGSGSLLLKAADEAGAGITIYGQENDNATRALAVMNMWLHGNPTSDIRQGNTLANPEFTNDSTGELRQFDYAVANPPFSYKSWMNGLDPVHDVYKRFEGYDAVPPKKNGDYAFLLHLLKSLKSTGKACIVLPLGVLFRGNAEGEIRKKIIQKGYIKGIIGLPPNLFYGTGIAACLVVLDKEDAGQRKDVFLIDASKGFIKDGNKNRLREQDIHKIVDTFNKQLEIPGYSRMVPVSEIADTKNDYNLNIPRYIDSQEEEDIQDIEAHLRGGIPARDIDSMAQYWTVYPGLKNDLFSTSAREAYYDLKCSKDEIRDRIFSHPDFQVYSEEMEKVYRQWQIKTRDYLLELQEGLHPKGVIQVLSESLLAQYQGRQLTDKYSMYQHLMDYWAEVMQDDMYELAADGWKAGNEVRRLTKKVKEKDKDIAGIEGLEGRLIPPELMIEVYLNTEKAALEELEASQESLNSEMEELKEEQGGEDGLLANALNDAGNIIKGSLAKALKDLGKRDVDNAEEWDMLKQYQKLMDQESEAKGQIKILKAELEEKVIRKYPTLSLEEIRQTVVDRKWMRAIGERIQAEMDNISHRLTQRIKELAERYEETLPELTKETEALTQKVEGHLAKMGFTWQS